MTGIIGDALNFSATSTFSIATPPRIETLPIPRELSGVVLNQNQGISTTTSDDITLPAATISVRTTTGFPPSGQIRIGTRVISYTNKTETEFTGCSAEDFVTELPLTGSVIRDSLVVSERGDNFTAVSDGWLYQHFRLPADYPRQAGEGVFRVPPLTGLQVDVGIEVGYSVVAALDWRIDYLKPGTGWIGLAQGTEVGAPYDGEHVWFDINFQPINIVDTWEHRFRFGIAGRAFEGVEAFEDEEETIPDPLATIAEVNGNTLTIEENTFDIIPDISPVPLRENHRYVIDNDGTPGLLVVEAGSGIVYYGKQQGVTKVWYSAPNPYASNDLRAYHGDGVEAIQDTDLNDVSFRFRILADAPTGDIDSLGSDYRNVVVSNGPENTVDADDVYWLSKPNPSEFGCEALYFDMRDGKDAVVIDRLLIDPVTPGVFFHIYYSNDPAPGNDTETWDQLLWTKVNRSFRLNRRESIPLPEPITAKYVKVEFTKLQPYYYAPGVLNQPTPYRRHPQWVIAYYLALYEQNRTDVNKHSSRVAVRYSAYDLAYNYYVGDIVLGPDAPSIDDIFITESLADIDRVDSETAKQISTSFRPFQQNPYLQGRIQNILNLYDRPDDMSNYSTETITTTTANTSEVSSLDRENLVIEKEFPVTSFYLTCRHFYREVQASFDHDRGYFVGLKEIAFTRDHYSSVYDHDIYIESAGDNVNIEHNDLTPFGTGWAAYDDTS